MAIIIKSNVSVQDPENKLPIYTKFGVVENEISVMVDTLESMEYEPVYSQIVALNDFVKELKTAGIWDKTLEVYPFVGKNMATAGVKLKTATSLNTMQPVGSFINDESFEYSNGSLLGKKLVNAQDSGFNTGLKGSEITNGYGLHVYSGEVVPTSQGDYRSTANLWGATSDEPARTGVFVAGVANSSNSTLNFRVANSSGYEQFSQDTTGGGVLQAVAKQSGLREFYFNGNKQQSTSGTVDSGMDTNSDLYLFARNGYGANSAAVGHYYPAVRFAMLTNGDVSSSDNEIIRSAINTLMDKMGRTFS